MEINFIMFDNPIALPKPAREFNEQLNEAIYTRNCGYIGQFIMQNPQYNLQWYESKFRELNTDIFLIAAPQEKNPNKNVIPYDFHNKKEMPFWIWIVVNGIDEAVKNLENFGYTSYSDNYNNLEHTGFLMAK
jgi:hypothetical protein